MKKMIPFIFLMIVVGYNKSHEQRLYSGFNYPRLNFDSSSTSDMKVLVDYKGNSPFWLEFYTKGRITRRDTVMSISGTDFLMTGDYTVGVHTLSSVSAILNDTARTFVFFKIYDAYDLAMIETALNDSSIEIGFVASGTLYPGQVDQKTLTTILMDYKHYR